PLSRELIKPSSVLTVYQLPVDLITLPFISYPRLTLPDPLYFLNSQDFHSLVFVLLFGLFDMLFYLIMFELFFEIPGNHLPEKNNQKTHLLLPREIFQAFEVRHKLLEFHKLRVQGYCVGLYRMPRRHTRFQQIGKE